MHVPLQVKVLPNATEAGFTDEQIAPKYSVDGDSGLELYALADQEIRPFEPTLIKHGIAYQVPQGVDTELRPRSSTLMKHRVHIALGTIDNPYRGELGTCVLYIPQVLPIEGEYLGKLFNELDHELQNEINNSPDREVDFRFTHMLNKMIASMVTCMGLVRADMAPLKIKRGDRVSQLVLSNRLYADVSVVPELLETVRGEGGWGSTGAQLVK